MRHHWIEAATGHSSKQFAKGGRRTGHHPFKRGWVAVAVEQALGDLGSRTMPNAVSVILAARRSSEIASALFRSKSLAIIVFKTTYSNGGGRPQPFFKHGGVPEVHR
ncbi:hypothetical protein PI124_g11188 [Phytophthora idaei]|nr:hypothetical protein PI124_g11188 [Phytophthora idaei]